MMPLGETGQFGPQFLPGFDLSICQQGLFCGIQVPGIQIGIGQVVKLSEPVILNRNS